MELSELELINNAKAGDIQAYTDIVNLYKNRIYNVCYRMLGNKEEAEDTAQETFIKLYSNLDKYNDKYKFSTWVYKIATNLCIDRIRKRKPIYSLDKSVNDEAESDWHSVIPDEGKTPEEVVIHNELSDLIKSVFVMIPIKYRTIMTLKYVEDLSLKEISEIVNLPISTVKTRLHRGREQARQLLMVNEEFREGSRLF